MGPLPANLLRRIPGPAPDASLAALRPLVVVLVVALATLAALAAGGAHRRVGEAHDLLGSPSRTDRNAAVVAATVDFSAVTATSEPAGAFFVAFRPMPPCPWCTMPTPASASAEKSACASEAIWYTPREVAQRVLHAGFGQLGANGDEFLHVLDAGDRVGASRRLVPARPWRPAD